VVDIVVVARLALDAAVVSLIAAFVLALI